jgi:hypothetical protein
LRLELDLVVHLARAIDPVAEIHIRQPKRPGACDMIEDHIGAQRALPGCGVEERVDHRQTVRQCVGQSAGHEIAIAASGDATVGVGHAVFDDVGVDRRVLDHHRVIQHRHIGHAAISVAGIEIVPEQRVLRGISNGLARHGDQIAICFGDPALRS